MLSGSILRKSLQDQRWQVVGFGLVLAIVAALDIFIWPAYRETFQNVELPPAFEAFLGGGDLSIATGPGFLSAEFYSWIPILLVVYAIIQGTGATAGEESSGTLDLLLAQPVRRTHLVLAKTAAVIIGSVLIVAIGYAGFLVSMPFVEIKVSLADTAIANTNMLPITLFFFGLSLWLGTLAPSRAMAVAGAIGVATAAYFVNTIAEAVDQLDPLKFASPFYYFGAGQSLVHGFTWWHVLLLLGIAVACVALALRVFDGKDIGVSTGWDVRKSIRRVFAGA